MSRKGNIGGKKKRKMRPDIPEWEFMGMDYCWFCKTPDACGGCKAARMFLKDRPHKKQKGKHTNCHGKFDRYGDGYDE